MQFVDHGAALKKLCESVDKATTFYLDTEFDSSRAGKKLSLIQVATNEGIWLVDALSLKDLTTLGEVLGQPEAQWVLHAGQQDAELLTENLRLKAPPKLFDTQIAYALSSPEYSVSLAYLKFRLLGIRSEKGHQADDWLRRPLPASQLAYAAEDVEHLSAIKETLDKRLQDLSRGEIVERVCRETLWPQPEPAPCLRIDSFRNAWQLGAHSQAALQYLIAWYNDQSPKERRYGPDAKVLLSIAARRPRSPADLMRIKGVPKRWASEHGNRFVRRLRHATDQANTDNFQPLDPPCYSSWEEIELDAWLANTRARLCRKLVIAPELLLPSRLQKTIRSQILATEKPERAVDVLSGWRKELLEEPYLEMLRQFPLGTLS